MGRGWAALAWTGLALMNFLFVLAFDLWAHYTHNTTLTGMVRDWLHDPVMGPIIFGLLLALPAGLMYHFFVSH